MEEINIKLKLYKYEELEEKARENAFNEQLEFLYICPPEYENEKGEMEKENLDKWSFNDLNEYIEEHIKINEYLFYKNGELADLTFFCGKHERSGETELNLNGQLIKIEV